MRAAVWLCVAMLVATACGDARGAAPVAADQTAAAPRATPTEAPVGGALTVTATPAPTPTATPAPTATPLRKLRVFVAAEGPYSGGTGEVWVLEGAANTGFEVVKRIPQGGWPHNVSLSPDLKYVAVAQRSSHQVSVIDPIEMREIARFPVGKQPHGITWSPDSKYIYTAHERDTFIGRIEVGTWKMTMIPVGVPQHVTLTHPDRPHELWFTLTNTSEADHLRVYNFETKQVTKVRVQDVHDIYFTPDLSEIWSSSSGFLEQPSDRMVIYDPEKKTVKEQIRLDGHYPFHGMKVNRDGQYHFPNKDVMLISSHWDRERGMHGAGLLWVDWRSRKVLGQTPLGRHVFHMTYDPFGDRVLVTSNIDGMVNVIDAKTRQVMSKVPVPKAHGIVAIGIP